MGAPEGSNRKELIARIGTFFLLLGIGLIIFFVLSEAAQAVNFGYFCSGIIVLILGFVFRAQFKKETPSSGRFSLVKRFTPKAKLDQGKKK
jgi:hypothetical protein